MHILDSLTPIHLPLYNQLMTNDVPKQKSMRVVFSLSKGYLDLIKFFADKRGTTHSDVIRRALDCYELQEEKFELRRALTNTKNSKLKATAQKINRESSLEQLRLMDLVAINQFLSDKGYLNHFKIPESIQESTFYAVFLDDSGQKVFGMRQYSDPELKNKTYSSIVFTFEELLKDLAKNKII